MNSFFSYEGKNNSFWNVTSPIFPSTMVFIGFFCVLCSSTLISNSASFKVSIFNLLFTKGYFNATGPVLYTYTGCQIPILSSGGEGHQSTKLIPRSSGLGEKTSNATMFLFLKSTNGVT